MSVFAQPSSTTVGTCDSWGSMLGDRPFKPCAWLGSVIGIWEETIKAVERLVLRVLRVVRSDAQYAFKLFVLSAFLPTFGFR